MSAGLVRRRKKPGSLHALPGAPEVRVTKARVPTTFEGTPAELEAALTVPQRNALAALRARGTATSRDIAHDLWPNSPGWAKRSRGRTGNRNGALGATMPMKAATVLHRLAARGLIRHEQVDGVTRWHAD